MDRPSRCSTSSKSKGLDRNNSTSTGSPSPNAHTHTGEMHAYGQCRLAGVAWDRSRRSLCAGLSVPSWSDLRAGRRRCPRPRPPGYTCRAWTCSTRHCARRIHRRGRRARKDPSRVRVLCMGEWHLVSFGTGYAPLAPTLLNSTCHRTDERMFPTHARAHTHTRTQTRRHTRPGRASTRRRSAGGTRAACQWARCTPAQACLQTSAHTCTLLARRPASACKANTRTSEVDGSVQSQPAAHTHTRTCRLTP